VQPTRANASLTADRPLARCGAVRSGSWSWQSSSCQPRGGPKSRPATARARHRSAGSPSAAGCMPEHASPSRHPQQRRVTARPRPWPGQPGQQHDLRREWPRADGCGARSSGRCPHRRPGRDHRAVGPVESSAAYANSPTRLSAPRRAPTRGLAAPPKPIGGRNSTTIHEAPPLPLLRPPRALGPGSCSRANAATRSGPSGRPLSRFRRSRPGERFATHPSVSLDEADARIRHLGALHRALGINGEHAPAPSAADFSYRPISSVGLARSRRSLSWRAASRWTMPSATLRSSRCGRP
jgi:hypothetical protein